MSGQGLPDPAETFRVEAADVLGEVEQALLDLMERPGDKDLVDAVFRGLHTLKGSGAMFGFDALAGFTHHCEGAFDQVRKGAVAATPELFPSSSMLRTGCARWSRETWTKRSRTPSSRN